MLHAVRTSTQDMKPDCESSPMTAPLFPFSLCSTMIMFTLWSPVLRASWCKQTETTERWVQPLSEWLRELCAWRQSWVGMLRCEIPGNMVNMFSAWSFSSKSSLRRVLLLWSRRVQQPWGGPACAQLLHHPLAWLVFLASLPDLFYFFSLPLSICLVCISTSPCAFNSQVFFSRLSLGHRVGLQRVIPSAVIPKGFPNILNNTLQRRFNLSTSMLLKS